MSGVPYFFRLWRLMRMNRLVDLFDRVFLPLVGLPHGVTGCRPPEVRPSPPPWGWSAGLLVTPRVRGRPAPARAAAARLAIVDVAMIGVRYRAHRGEAGAVDDALLAGIETQDGH